MEGSSAGVLSSRAAEDVVAVVVAEEEEPEFAGSFLGLKRF